MHSWNLLRTVWRSYWKWVLGIGSGLALGIGVWIFGGPDWYESEVEFFPPDLSAASPLLREAALVPGSASDLERVYSYLSSPLVQAKLIDSFHLYEHYAISPTASPRKRARLVQRLLEQNLSLRITRNSTILVRVQDADPQYAYRMAEFLLREAEAFCKGIIRVEESLQEIERQIQALLAEMRTLEENLAVLRTHYRILTAGEQRTGTVQLGSPEALAFYDKVLSQETRLVRLQEAYADLLEEKYRRENLLRTYPQSVFVVQPPFFPTFPVTYNRWLIFFLGAAGSFVGTLLFFFYAYQVGLLPRKSRPEAQKTEPALSSLIR